MGRKSFKDRIHEKMMLKMIQEIEKLKKERDEMRLEALRFLDLYLKEKKEKEKLLAENVRLRCL